MTYKIKLQPGDYCRRDMGEDKYRECAQRFFDDGGPDLERVGGSRHCDFFGWTQLGFYHSSEALYGRLLTHEQIMEKETMTEPDWKTAPEGATHYCKTREDGFYRRNFGRWEFFNSNKNIWVPSYSDDKFHEKLIPRPSPSWHETGDLPPVGTECEANIYSEWVKVEVIKHSTNFAACHLIDTQFDGTDLKWSSKFRPIQSDRDKAWSKNNER